MTISVLATAGTAAVAAAGWLGRPHAVSAAAVAVSILSRAPASRPSISYRRSRDLHLSAAVANASSSGTGKSLAGDDAAEAEPGPLSGFRILDLTRVLAGMCPFCTMIFGDYGADVIKVESLAGDDTRSWGPPFAPTSDPNAARGESAYFLGLNRNKRSIAVDFSTPAGRDIVLGLAATSDAVIENFLPGRLSARGLGPEHVAAVNAGAVYCSVTGYGRGGPDGERAGYDVVVEAEGGLMDITGEEGGDGVKVGVAVVDVATGLLAQGAVTAALLARERRRALTGELRGQHVEVSLLETQVAMLANVAHAYLIGGVEGKRWGTRHASIVPYQAFPTKDGRIVIGA
ncbi:hypothetical protein HK405_011758, partial [Cladochytrium tenue]